MRRRLVWREYAAGGWIASKPRYADHGTVIAAGFMLSGRCAAGLGLLLGLCAAQLCATGAAYAQLIDRYFPAGLPGYGAQPGVTVQSRARPAYDPLGVRVGGIVVRPTLSTGLGYTSNALGQPRGRGSVLAQTSGSILAGSDWGRHAIGGFLSFDDQRYLSASAQSATAWTAALGGTMEIGRGALVLGAAHLDLFQTARAGRAGDRPARPVPGRERARRLHLAQWPAVAGAGAGGERHAL